MRFNIPLHVALITKDILNRMREKATTPERLAIAKANIALAPKNTGRRARFLTDFRRQAQAKRMVEKTLPFRVPPKPTISDDVILEFERLVLEDKLSVSQAAKKVGHAYQALNYGRMRMARAKGLPPPVALVSPQRAKVALGKKTSPVMTAEIVKQVDELVAHGGFTIRNALRSLGWAQPATYYSWKKRHGYKER
jgi:transposase-like protein